MENLRYKRDGIDSEVITYNKKIPFFRFCSACEHTLVTNDELSPLVPGPGEVDFNPVPGYGALYRLIGDGSHSPTFTSAFKKSSISDSYNDTLGVVNLITFLFDGSEYWYTIFHEA
jgi:hypothetical protein